MPSDPDPEITVIKSDSPEELAFKRAIKGMALRLFVETEQPILLTSAPASGLQLPGAKSGTVCPAATATPASTPP